MPLVNLLRNFLVQALSRPTHRWKLNKAPNLLTLQEDGCVTMGIVEHVLHTLNKAFRSREYLNHLKNMHKHVFNILVGFLKILSVL